MNKKFGIKIPTWARYFLVSKTPRPARPPTQPKFHTYRSSFLRVKRLGHEAVQSLISSAKFKNEWSCNSAPPVWSHAVVTDKFTFFFTLFFHPEHGGSRDLRNVCMVPFCLTIKRRKFFFVETAMRCISNLTYRLTRHAIRTFRRVVLLPSLVRLRNGGGTYLTNARSQRQNQRCNKLKCQE